MQQQSLKYLATVLMVAAVMGGCRKSTVVNDGPEGFYNLVSVVKAYNMTTARSRPPQRLDDLLPALKSIGDPERLLTSPRDGKPYVIVWGIDLRRPQMPQGNRNGDIPIVAYEQEGKDGKRQAINVRLNVQEYTAEEIAQMKLPPADKSGK